ncbi:MAG: hypothetical protein QOE45_2479 [Frankiaceae bacterium]|jgi:hypothetical protein|nr:hypothetical protein [Frankiaceae bacterium]
MSTSARRRVVVAALLLATATPTLSRASGPATGVPSRGATVRVPLDGRGSIEVTIPDDVLGRARPGGTTSLRATRTASSSSKGAAVASAPSRPAGDLSADGARQFPADAAATPGTVASIAGGYCEGYPAGEATISPTRLTYDRDGRLWWVDDDQSIVNGGNHDRGSSLLRTLDAAGRVRTVAPLIEPQEGREDRQDLHSWMRSRPVADPRGGVLVQVSHNLFGGYNARYGDGPLSGAIYRFTADGRRELIAGRPDLPLAPTTHGDADGPPATQSVIGYVSSIATDDAGNVYFAESTSPAYFDHPRANLVRVVNRTDDTLRYYAGTPDEVTVAPGAIGTLASDLEPGDATSLLPGRGNGGSARKARFALVPAMQVRNDVLYLLDLIADPAKRARGQDIATGQVRAVNLGLGDRAGATVAYGVPLPVGAVDGVAGGTQPVSGSAGDGGPARAATFLLDVTNQTGDLAIDRAGTLYIADSLADRVRAVDPRTALIRTVAGTGTGGEAVEAAPATAAALWQPVGITVDPQDRLVLADYLNARVRRLDGDGRLRAVVGRGPTPCGDGQLATGRSVNGGAMFGDVSDTAVDSKGRVYVGDVRYHQVRRVDPDGRVRVVVGQPTRCVGNYLTGLAVPGSCPGLGTQYGDGGPYAAAGLAAPHFLATDLYDNLYVSDVDRVRYVNFADRPVSVHGITVAPGTIATVVTYPSRTVRVTGTAWGVPLDIEFPAPIGDLAVDDAGNLYVADPVLDYVYRLGPCGHTGLLVGTGQSPARGGDGDGGPAHEARVSPRGLAFDRARRALLISDMNGSSTAVVAGTTVTEVGGNRIRAVNLGDRAARVFGVTVGVGTIETVAGTRSCLYCSTGDGQPAIDAGISAGSTLAIGAGGRLYVTDPFFQRVRVVLPDGRIAGVTSFWPEGDWNALPPAGYRGDGGQAMEAWFGLWYYRNWQGVGVVGSVTATPAGDLLVADASGRVRRVRDAYDAPLRTAVAAPGPPGAGVGFSATTMLEDDFPAASGVPLPLLHGGATAPDVYVSGAEAYVLGSRGNGRGCALWRVRPGAGPGGTDVAEFAGQPGVARSGAGLGGAGCAVGAAPGAAGRLAVVTAERATGGTEASVLAAVSVDDGATAWRSNPAATLTARANGTGLAMSGVATTGGENVLAYAASDGTIHLAASPDGTVYLDRGSLSVGPADIGDLTAAPDGVLYLGLTTSAGGPAVVVARSADGGRTWAASTLHRPAGDAARVPSSAPSVAVDAAGTAYATWSDDRAVYLSRSVRGRWSAPALVSDGVTGVLPTVAAGAAGRVAVAFYGVPGTRTAGAADPYLRWYGYLARSVDATATRPHWDVAVATPASVHQGRVCVAEPCPRETASGVAPVDDVIARTAALGRARVRLGEGGRLGIAYTVRTVGTDGAATAIGYVRPCTGPFLVADPALPPCTSKGAVPPITPRPDPAPLPVVTVPSIAPCSPVPPPPAHQPSRPRDRERPRRTEPESPNEPGHQRGLPPLLVPPPQGAPANGRPFNTEQSAQNQGQQQAQNQSQGQGQGGAAIEPDDQEQGQVASVEEYAMSDRRAGLPVALYASSLLLATAFAVRGSRALSRSVQESRPSRAR